LMFILSIGIIWPQYIPSVGYGDYNYAT